LSSRDFLIEKFFNRKIYIVIDISILKEISKKKYLDEENNMNEKTIFKDEMYHIKEDIKILSYLNGLISNKNSLAILYMLAKRGEKGIKMTDMIQLLDTSPGTFYPTIKKFIEKGYIDKDEYLMIFRLTKEGENLTLHIFNGLFGIDLEEKEHK